MKRISNVRRKPLFIEDDIYDDHGSSTAETIHEGDDNASAWSGLYDADGNKLYSVKERLPIGFHIRKV